MKPWRVYLQVKLAKDLCKAAISENAYCPLVHNDLFKVVLTPGLGGVELHLLMEEHLRRLADEVNVDSMQPLSIQFCPGMCIMASILPLVPCGICMQLQHWFGILTPQKFTIITELADTMAPVVGNSTQTPHPSYLLCYC